MRVALAPLAAGKIEFQIRVTARNLGNVLQRSFAEGRASQIGVQNDSGGVDDWAQRIGEPALNEKKHVFRYPGDICPDLILLQFPLLDHVAQFVQCQPHIFDRQAVSVLGDDLLDRL